MSTVDPSRVRPWRAVVAVVVYAISVVAAGATGWGWMFSAAPVSEVDTHATAFALGMIVMILLLVLASFLAPTQARTGSRAAPLFIGAMGVEALAVAAGMFVADGTSIPFYVVGAIAVVVLCVAVFVRWRTAHKQAALADVLRTGTTTVGTVTSAQQTSVVNGAPRWRFAIRFVDAQGTTRWITKHAITWSPIAVGQQLQVRYDPKQPGAKHRIFVDGIDR